MQQPRVVGKSQKYYIMTLLQRIINKFKADNPYMVTTTG